MKKFYFLFIALFPVLAWGQISWNFGTGATPLASPSSGAPVTNITSISDISQGNNNGTTTLLTTTSPSSGYAGVSGSYNAGAAARTGALVTGASGSAYFEFTLTPAAGFSVFVTEIDFGTRSTGTGAGAYSIRTNLDNYAADIAAGTIANNSSWALKTNTLSFTGTAGTAVTFRIYGHSGAGSPAANTANWRIDDLAVSATATSSGGGNTPAIVVGASGLTAFTTVTGTASAAQIITVGGTNLTHDIIITAPSLYEISVDGGATYSTTPATLTQAGGTVSNTPVSIRIGASAPTGAANGNIIFTSTDAADQTVALTGTVSSGVTVAPAQAFSATAVSASEIDLAATGNVAGNNIVVATNATATFGTPTGTLTAGNTISGGGTVLYSGSASGFTFQHTGLNASTKYFYQIWSVDGSSNYSTALTANATTTAVVAPAANVVINQIYGGGGNSGAYYKNDFIELYNNESTPVNLSGWSVQYTNATGTSWTTTPLSGIVPAHSFFLVQEAAGANASAVNLPTPDVTGTLTLGATGGKVILSNSTTAQTTSNPTVNIIDKVGFGTANAYEGSGPAPVTDNTTSVTRVTDGVDNNNNATDFALTSPVPRNTAYIITPPGISSLMPQNGAVDISSSLVPTIVFDKPIVKASGAITIYQDGVAGTPIDVNATTVVISNGKTVTINTTLLPGKSYYILISAGAFADVYGNGFAGIASNTAWAFTTYNSGVAATLPVKFDFQTCTGTGLLPNGFTQYSISGTQLWDCTNFGRDSTVSPTSTVAFPNAVQINGYANNIDNLNRDWLISPKLDLTGTTFPLLSFWSRTAFAGDPLELKISTDYTGSGDPSLATWTDLNGKFPGTGSDTWTISKDINLFNFKQSSVYFAFVYTSTTDDGSRWTIDDISLINSPAPPAPSLTLGSTNIEFGYTASGSNSTKLLNVTGNDLVGDITLTATGNFQVSTDGISFASTVIIPKAVANDVQQTVSVRFAPGITNTQFNETLSVSISDSTGVINLKGNSIDPASTLNIVNWNMAWFATPDPTPGFGPANKSTQQDNAATVLKSIGADLFVLQEVVNEHALDSIVQTMPGYAYKINNYGSYSNPALAHPTDLKFIQKLAFVYKTSKFSNIHTDSLLTLGIALAADTATSYYNAFASGRFPYMMSADVTLSDNNGGFITHPMRFINLHAKANTSPELTAYARRVTGARAIDSLIKVNYSNDIVLLLGDINDDLNQTITKGVTPPRSSYYPFTEDDAALYIFPTKPLSPAGQHSDVNFTGSVIDNVIATANTGKYYLPASATVLSDVANLVTKYGTTTSDHYPVFTQFSFSTAAALPVTLLSFTAVKQNTVVKVSWSTSQEVNSQLFDVERSADGNSFTKVGTVTAQGLSSIKVDYVFSDNQPLNGNNYYRLKQVDKDGKFVYSKVVKINFTKLPGIRISPNPASSWLYLSMENINSTVNLQVIDGNGKLVKQQLITQGTVNKTISLSGMAKGLYTIKMISQEQVSTQKLLVQ